MRKILITGGTTFVSKYVAEYYAKNGDEVYVINRNSREQVSGVTLINADRTNLGDRLKDIHFDAVLDITAYTEEHVRTLVNSLGSFDDYIFISSSAVYPETNVQPFDESQQCGKNTHTFSDLRIFTVFTKIATVNCSYLTVRSTTSRFICLITAR